MKEHMTRDQRLVAWIAETVRGWKVMLRADWVRVGWSDVLVDCGEEGYFFAEKESSATTAFDPLTNPTDALDALDAWCDIDDDLREYSIDRNRHPSSPETKRYVTLRRFHYDLDNGCEIPDAKDIYDGFAPTLPRAICEALGKATGWKVASE